MFNPHADPIDNVPVYQRIKIGANDPEPAMPPKPRTSAEIVQDIAWEHEHRRIWNLVKGAAEGTNISSKEEASTPTPYP